MERVAVVVAALVAAAGSISPRTDEFTRDPMSLWYTNRIFRARIKTQQRDFRVRIFLGIVIAHGNGEVPSDVVVATPKVYTETLQGEVGRGFRKGKPTRGRNGSREISSIWPSPSDTGAERSRQNPRGRGSRHLLRHSIRVVAPYLTDGKAVKLRQVGVARPSPLPRGRNGRDCGRISTPQPPSTARNSTMLIKFLVK